MQMHLKSIGYTDADRLYVRREMFCRHILASRMSVAEKFRYSKSAANFNIYWSPG
jgi:hypothetical protein